MAATKNLEKTLTDTYGDIDKKSFKENSFITDGMKKDLKEEGLESLYKDSKDKVKVAEEESDDKKTENNEKTEKKSEKKNIADGKRVYDTLGGHTDSRYYSEISETLDSIDENDVLSFLKGYYDASGYDGGSEGIIEQMDDEIDGGRINMSSKKHLISTFLDKAKSMGFENDDDYKTIESIYKVYTDDPDYSEYTTFNNNDAVWPKWLGGTLICTNDNEKIDRAMKRLYDKMQ